MQTTHGYGKWLPWTGNTPNKAAYLMPGCVGRMASTTNKHASSDSDGATYNAATAGLLLAQFVDMTIQNLPAEFVELLIGLKSKYSVLQVEVDDIQHVDTLVYHLTGLLSSKVYTFADKHMDTLVVCSWGFWTL